MSTTYRTSVVDANGQVSTYENTVAANAPPVEEAYLIGEAVKASRRARGGELKLPLTITMAELSDG